MHENEMPDIQVYDKYGLTFEDIPMSIWLFQWFTLKQIHL